MTLRRRALGLASVLAVVAGFVACTGDDPLFTAPSDTNDAGPPAPDAGAPDSGGNVGEAGTDAPSIALPYDSTFGENGVFSITGGIRSISGVPKGKGELAYVDSAPTSASQVHWVSSAGAIDPNTPLTTMTVGNGFQTEHGTVMTALWDQDLLYIGGAGDIGDGTGGYFARGVPLDRPATSTGVGTPIFANGYGTPNNADLGALAVVWPNPHVNDGRPLTVIARVDSTNREFVARAPNGAQDKLVGFGEIGGAIAAPNAGSASELGRVATVVLDTFLHDPPLPSLRLTVLTTDNAPAPATDFGNQAADDRVNGSLSFNVAGTVIGTGIGRVKTGGTDDYLVVAGSTTLGLVGAKVAHDGTNPPASLTQLVAANDFALHAFVNAHLSNLHYAGGCIRQSTTPTPWIARLTNDGTLDPTFGQGGVITLDAMSGACMTALTVDDTDRVVAVINPVPFAAATTSRVVRFTP